MGDIKETLKEVQCTLAGCLKTYIDNGVGNADINQVGETIDAIKDLAETKYYCVVTEAMEKGERYPYEDERMGYTQPHYPGGTAGRMTSNSNMGYPNGWDDIYGYNATGNSRSVHHDDHMYKPMIDQEPYIRDYIEWKDSKRHYTETHTAEDKTKMDENMRKHFNNFIANAREMYKDADISSKQEMKSDLLALINSL